MSNWFNQLMKAKKSCIVDGNLKKIRYEFDNGKELVEEYNTDTKILNRRAWKKRSGAFHDEGNWEIEVGDPHPTMVKHNLFINEASTQPFISCRHTKNTLEWRIRNLTYPKEVYFVNADEANKGLEIRTSNKKYYKKFPIPDLERINSIPEQKNITFVHKYNTLIITYKKPQQLIDLEEAIMTEIDKLEPKKFCGDINNCKQS